MLYWHGPPILSCPDLTCLVNKLAQVTKKSFDEKHIKALSAGIKSALDIPIHGLLYVLLDANSVQMGV